MQSKLFKFDNFISPGEAFHIARVKIHSQHDLSLHHHDYAEIFWVEDGSGWHHINKQKVKLSPGHIVMMRPGDMHTFSSSSSGLTIMNVAFSTETLHLFQKRYFPNSNQYFWTISHVPYKTWVPHHLLQRISSRAEQVVPKKRSNMQLDSFLLFVFRLLTEHQRYSPDENIPTWLVNANQKFNTPELLKSGPQGFAQLCERSLDHVNRVVKRHHNKSLTDLVNEHRMNFAAQQLTITGIPIKTICQDCGFQNLSYFYKVFKKYYHLTPSHFRDVNQKIV